MMVSIRHYATPKDKKMWRNSRYNFFRVSNKAMFGKPNHYAAKKKKRQPASQNAYLEDLFESASNYWTRKTASSEAYWSVESKRREGKDKEALLHHMSQDTLDNAINEASAIAELETLKLRKSSNFDPFHGVKSEECEINNDFAKIIPVISASKPESKCASDLLFNPQKPTFNRIKLRNKLEYSDIIRHRYQDSNSNPNLPSVSKILKATMSEESKKALDRWKERMILQLGEDGFQKYQQETFAQGHRLHSHLENYLITGKSRQESEETTLNHLKSLGSVLHLFSRPYALESSVVHPDLGYHGFLDCVALYRKSNLVLIDWKTSERKKDSLAKTFDNPLQLAAYVGAFNHDERYGANVDRAMIVLAYNDGSKADVLQIQTKTVMKYWTLWLERLSKYKRLFQ